MNLEQFKKLPFKEKMKWIWDYYAVTIVVAVVTIVILCLLITSMLGIRKNQNVGLSVLILDDRMDEQCSNSLHEEISKIIGDESEISFYSKSNEEQFSAFVVRTAVDGPDIVIAPLEEISEMAQNGYVYDDYVEIKKESFYNNLFDIDKTNEKYEDVYIGKAKRGKNPENALLIWERLI